MALIPSLRAACPDSPFISPSSTISPFSAIAGCISVGSPTIATSMCGNIGRTDSIPPRPLTSSSHDSSRIRLYERFWL